MAPLEAVFDLYPVSVTQEATTHLVVDSLPACCGKSYLREKPTDLCAAILRRTNARRSPDLRNQESSWTICFDGNGKQRSSI